jgi:hypothetical protein
MGAKLSRPTHNIKYNAHAYAVKFVRSHRLGGRLGLRVTGAFFRVFRVVGGGLFQPWLAREEWRAIIGCCPGVNMACSRACHTMNMLSPRL